MERHDEQGAPSLWRYATSRLTSALRSARIKNLCVEDIAEVEIGLPVYGRGKAYRLPADIDARMAEAYAVAGVSRPPTI